MNEDGSDVLSAAGVIARRALVRTSVGRRPQVEQFQRLIVIYSRTSCIVIVIVRGLRCEAARESARRQSGALPGVAESARG